MDHYKLNEKTDCGFCLVGDLQGKQIKCEHYDPGSSSPRCHHLHQNNRWCDSWPAWVKAKSDMKEGKD